jgi:hypothetical protein
VTGCQWYCHHNTSCRRALSVSELVTWTYCSKCKAPPLAINNTCQKKICQSVRSTRWYPETVWAIVPGSDRYLARVSLEVSVTLAHSTRPLVRQPEVALLPACLPIHPSYWQVRVFSSLANVISMSILLSIQDNDQVATLTRTTWWPVCLLQNPFNRAITSPGKN